MKTWQKLKQNPELFNRYFVKEYIIKAVRKFFEERNYHELESPILSSALPQERYLDILKSNIKLASGENLEAYLLPSTERFNKIILAAGLGNHFVITKVFRGLEEISPNHSPEFTMLEWYELDHNYFDLMKSSEELFLFIKKFLDEKFGREFNPFITYQGQGVNLEPPWDRISIREGLQKYSGINLDEIIDIENFRKIAANKGYNIDEKDDWQTIFEMVFANEIETNFAKDKPTFVYDYPKLLCPLTKVNEKDPAVCEKVEIYMCGRELGNGYTELLDGFEQEKRFREEQNARVDLGKKPVKFDDEMIEAMKSGMPDVAGIGMGLDRIAMLFADAKSISDINFFPAAEMFE